MYQLLIWRPQGTTLPAINYKVLALISYSVRVLFYIANGP